MVKLKHGAGNGKFFSYCFFFYLMDKSEESLMSSAENGDRSGFHNVVFYFMVVFDGQRAETQ
jgi:hypothetical protein